MPLLEICAANIASALAAQSAGAHRIELCCALESGGLTPSAGAILEARRALDLPVMVLIRPREGNFCYTRKEVQQMCADIHFCRQAGVAGVVIGALTPDGDPDEAALDALQAAAGTLELTFHRAFDFTADPESALETIIRRGFHRLLSSGCAPSAWEGRNRLADMVRQAGQRIAIMPGAGISAGNIADIAGSTLAREFHCSAKSWLPQDTGETSIPGLESGYWVSDPLKIKDTLAALLSGKTG